jgi:SPOR domain
MMNKGRFLIVGLGTAGLFSCTGFEQNYYARYPTSRAYAYENAPYYPLYHPATPYYGGFLESSPKVVTRKSYYLGENHLPTSHKDVDRDWVEAQSPNDFTIEVAEDEKAAMVAGKLHQAPKRERSAEVKYYRDGKYYYKGVYGSYSNREEAQKALNSLPAEIKQGAGVKNWNSVQESIKERARNNFRN